MAGAGYKLFSTGDVLSASDVNTYLQQQTVMVFASAAARTSALSSVLAEGMVSYLKDTDVVEIYTGASWVSLDDPNAIQNSVLTAKGALVTATAASTPSALAVGTNGFYLQADSTTATGLKWAAVSAPSSGLSYIASSSPSAAASLTMDSVFSSTYQNYLLTGYFTGSADAGVMMRLRAGGTDLSGSNYSYTVLFNDTSSVSGTGGGTSQTAAKFANSGSSGTSVFSTVISNPFASVATGYMTNQARFIGGSQARCDFFGGTNLTNSYDGFKLYPDTGTFTGVIRLYGIANS